jgi:hypothetical protein
VCLGKLGQHIAFINYYFIRCCVGVRRFLPLRSTYFDYWYGLGRRASAVCREDPMQVKHSTNACKQVEANAWMPAKIYPKTIIIIFVLRRDEAKGLPAFPETIIRAFWWWMMMNVLEMQFMSQYRYSAFGVSKIWICQRLLADFRLWHHEWSLVGLKKITVQFYCTFT